LEKIALKALPTPRMRGAIPNWRSTPSLRAAGFEDETSELVRQIFLLELLTSAGKG
jgi:hypothetical protein